MICLVCIGCHRPETSSRGDQQDPGAPEIPDWRADPRLGLRHHQLVPESGLLGAGQTGSGAQRELMLYAVWRSCAEQRLCLKAQTLTFFWIRLILIGICIIIFLQFKDPEAVVHLQSSTENPGADQAAAEPTPPSAGVQPTSLPQFLSRKRSRRSAKTECPENISLPGVTSIQGHSRPSLVLDCCCLSVLHFNAN